MRRILFITTFTLSALAAFAQPENPHPAYRFSLEDCLEYALGNNYGRQSMVLSEESREISLDQSRLERLPSLNASISENLNHTRGNSASWDGSYGLSTSMIVYQGGSINTTIEQNQLYLEQSAYQTYRYDNELTISILQTFLSILGNEEMLKYQRSVLRASEEQLRQGEAQYAVGMILESDYLLLQSQYASDLNNILQTEASLENNLLTLKGLLSMDMDTSFGIIHPDTTMMSNLAVLPPSDYAVARALTTMPELDIIRYSVAIAENNLKLARSDYFPTVSVGGSLGSGHSRNFQNYGDQVSDRFSQQAGVSVSIPIFNRGRTRSSVAQNRISLLQTELDERQTQLDIQRTVLQEYTDIGSAYNNYEASRIREQAYRESFEAYHVQFNLGVITTVDLLQQQNNYISALNDFIQSKYTFILRRKILDVYMGEPIRM